MQGFVIPITLEDLANGAKQFAASEQAKNAAQAATHVNGQHQEGKSPPPQAPQVGTAGQRPQPNGNPPFVFSFADLFSTELQAARLEAAASGCACPDCAFLRYAKRLEQLVIRVSRMTNVPQPKPQ